jgi:hypothetical protein
MTTNMNECYSKQDVYNKKEADLKFATKVGGQQPDLSKYALVSDVYKKSDLYTRVETDSKFVKNSEIAKYSGDMLKLQNEVTVLKTSLTALPNLNSVYSKADVDNRFATKAQILNMDSFLQIMKGEMAQMAQMRNEIITLKSQVTSLTNLVSKSSSK